MKPSTIVKIAVAGIFAIMALIAACGSFYTVDEAEYALALRFGELKAVRTAPGLYVKAPLVDSLQRIDKRTLRADIPPREVPDKDKERLIIDVVIRYRIDDPVQFRKTLRNEATALERLKTITYSALRDTIAQHDRTEVIGARLLKDEAGQQIYDEEGLPVYEPLTESRAAISQSIHNRIDEAVTGQNFGIQILSADIKRAEFPGSVKASIINRLTEERKRVAADHRARGEEEYLSRTAAVDAEAAVIIAEAEAEARQVRGQGEADAIQIIRETLLLDQDFYQFVRTLESYRKLMTDNDTLVITTPDDEGLFRYLLGLKPLEPTAPNLVTGQE